jgi:alkanesulfonate monooxygenase SsuD/methylene tetrahydromethanopterin reductase-like flavin-dependent oxidoreductase (luciferase family)
MQPPDEFEEIDAMHIGYAPVFQNLGRKITDYEAYRAELRLLDLVEPLGFESIWEPEHHFTDYEMTPDVLQFLTYCAGRTKAVKLGSMVVVLPWHDPLRVAEQIVLLDQLSDGRAILGIGRGLGAVEFDGFRVDMSNSRGIFNESADALVKALHSGFMEYDGEFIKQPRRELRPAPFKSFEGRLFGAGLSPETGPIMANLGLGMMIFPLKAWADVRRSLDEYGKEWQKVRPGTEPPKSIQVAFCYVDKDPVRAREIATEHVKNYYNSIIAHYDMAGDRLKGTKGYEFYQKTIQANQDNLDDTIRNFVDLMPWGTPQQVIEKLTHIHNEIDNNAVIAHFAFGGMDYDVAEKSMRLFAAEVMPAVKAIKTTPFLEPSRKTEKAA